MRFIIWNNSSGTEFYTNYNEINNSSSTKLLLCSAPTWNLRKVRIAQSKLGIPSLQYAILALRKFQVGAEHYYIIIIIYNI